MDETKAIQSLKSLLWELPVEFSDGPPNIKEKGLESFYVIKKSNVRKVHQALWDLQVQLGMQEER